MGLIAAVEDALRDSVTEALGNTIKKSGGLPGGWTAETLQRALQFAPCVYVSFNGMVPGLSEGYHNGRFSIYVVTKGVDDQNRRRGNNRIIGAYDIVERLLPLIDGLSVTGIGTARVRTVDNLFRDVMFELGGAVYAIQVELQNMPLEYEADLSSMADFVLWHADHYNPGGIAAGDDPLATDEVTP